MRRLYRWYLVAERYGLIPNFTGIALGILLAFFAMQSALPQFVSAVEQGVKQACVDLRQR